MKNIKKVVLITGGSKGIGLATAKIFAQNGYIVYAGARNSFEEQGIKSLVLDVTDNDSVLSAVDTVIKNEGRLDIVINNAGMGISGAVEYTSDEEAKYIFDVNFFGAFKMIKAAVPYLRKTKGKIINISSVASCLSIPFQSFYSSTKAALDAMTFALRSELKPFGIKVTSILPGDTKTQFTDARVKSFMDNDPIYGDTIAKSISLMERDERSGMPAEKIAKAVYKVAGKKRLPTTKTIGFKYKVFLFLNKVLPRRLVVYIVGKMYS